MKGIKMSDCKFYVNEEERIVVCVIPGTRNLLLDFIESHFSFNDVNLYGTINYWGNKWSSGLELPSSFMGKAVCSQDDVWDEEVGRMLAFSRAKDKCYKSFFKRANNLVQTIDRRLCDMLTTFNDFGMKLEDKRIDLEHKIEEKTKVGDA